MAYTTSPATPLQAARVARGLSQREVAAMAGITPVALSHLETGKTSPKHTTARALSKALGATTDQLFPSRLDDADAQAEYFERTGQLDDLYRGLDPTEWRALTIEQNGRRFVEQPPEWFAAQVAAARGTSK